MNGSLGRPRHTRDDDIERDVERKMCENIDRINP